jgi:ERF superfamily protein
VTAGEAGVLVENDITPRSKPIHDGDMLAQIIERAAFMPEFDIDRVTRLIELKTKWDAAEGVKAYARAMVEFKKNPPQILKNKHVSYGTTNYDHATHDEVTHKLSDALAHHGITHRWGMTQTEKSITVRCTLTHVGGHSDYAELTSVNDGSGGKNATQAVASANQYLQRYTLLAVTGTSTTDIADDDGRESQGPVPECSDDVWRTLGGASAEGQGALAAAWKGLQDTTRAVITLYYKERWEALKENARENDGDA